MKYVRSSEKRAIQMAFMAHGVRLLMFECVVSVFVVIAARLCTNCVCVCV